jgi:hypothetical protein
MLPGKVEPVFIPATVVTAPLSCGFEEGTVLPRPLFYATNGTLGVSWSNLRRSSGADCFSQGIVFSHEWNPLIMYSYTPTYLEPYAEERGIFHRSFCFFSLGMTPTLAARYACRPAFFFAEVFA